MEPLSVFCHDSHPSATGGRDAGGDGAPVSPAPRGPRSPHALRDPSRWGLPPEAVLTLGERLYQLWERFHACFRTRTRDTGEYAYHYLSGLLRLERARNFANIGRHTNISGENLQHFISNSPWSATSVLCQVWEEIAHTPGVGEGGVLILDESADEKASAHTAGAGRQHNGRLGKVEMSQVGTFLAYANGPLWSWVNGRLFLPEHWFAEAYAAQRQRLGIPTARTFATKIALGWEMIQEVRQGPLPFAAVLCDALYGKSEGFRRQMDEAGLCYLADVPEKTLVYLTPPTAIPRQIKRGTQRRTPEGAPPWVWRGDALSVGAVGERPDTVWRRIAVRPTERGVLADEFAARRVWTVREEELAQEWLVMRREGTGDVTYALGNSPPVTPLEELARLKCGRYFVERAIQDSKTEAGWDELEAQKYRAWEHHLALTILATWFGAQTKWDWAQQHPRDPALPEELGVDLLPALSLANVRELLRAVMPLPQFSPEDAVQLVVTHLLQRTRARKSRLKTKKDIHPPT